MAISTIISAIKQVHPKDIEIKNRIRSNSYDLLEISYEANSTSDMQRKVRLLEKSIAKIKVIDFLLDLSYENNLISHKKLLKLGLKMDDIIKYKNRYLSLLVGYI